MGKGHFSAIFLMILLLENDFGSTSKENEGVSQSYEKETYTRSRGRTEFNLESALKVGATATQFVISSGPYGCEFEGQKVGNAIKIKVNEKCKIIAFTSFFRELNVGVMENTIIAGKDYDVNEIIMKNDQDGTVEVRTKNGPTLGLLKSSNSNSVLQYLNVYISKKQRKFYIEFRYHLSTIPLLYLILKSSYDNPETFEEKGSDPLDYIEVKHIVRDSLGMDYDFLKNENIDFSRAKVDGEYYATYKPGEVFEFLGKIKKRDIGFMNPADDIDGYLLIQQTFGDIEVEPNVALVFFTSSPRTIQEIAREFGYHRHVNLFNPSGIDILAVTCSNGEINTIRTPILMSKMQDYTTTETRMAIPQGINLVMRYPHSGRSPNNVIFHGNIGDKMVITTEANLTTDVKSIVNIFKNIQPNMETNYRKIASTAPGMFWKAEIQQDGVFSIKINVSSALSILEPVMDIKNLTWNFNFDPTGSSLTANGENYVAGEITSTHLAFSGSAALITGDLRRAFSVKQLLANVGINPTYMVGFEHLIIPLISDTKFEIDLSAVAANRELIITAASTVIGCAEESVTITIEKYSTSLVSGVEFECSSAIYLHEAMKHVYLKDVVREQWILLKYINFNFYLDAHLNKVTRKINAETEEMTTCPLAERGLRDQQSLCSFLKNRIDKNKDIIITGALNPNDFKCYFHELTNDGAYHALDIDLTTEPSISQSLTLIRAYPHLYYADGESTFEIECTLSMNDKLLHGNASIKTIGQSKPYITTTLSDPAHDIMGNTWVRLEKGAKGYGVINPAKPLKIVFTSGVTIGAATPESAKTFDHEATVTLGDGIMPRLVAHSNDHDTIPMTLRRFGAIDYHNSLEGIHFINGYTIRYCGISRSPEDICSLPGYSVTHNSKLMVTGKIFYLHATIDVNIYASDATLVIEGTTDIITAQNGKVTFQRENEDGTGPRFYLASVNREGGVGKAIFKGHLYAEGITYDGEMGYVQRPEKKLPSLMAEGITCSWHGEVDYFDFKVFLDPNPTFSYINYEIQANRKQNTVVDTHHMEETLQYYLGIMDKTYQQFKNKETESESKQKSIELLVEDSRRKLLASDDRLKDLVDILSSLEPTLKKECVDECKIEQLFGIYDPEGCSENHIFECLEWKHLQKTVVDYNCVADCEARKIISRDTINKNWKTAEIMLPRYKRMLALSNFLEEQESIVYQLQQKIQSYASKVRMCYGSSPDQKRYFDDILLHFRNHHTTYNIVIKQLSSTIKMEDRINVEKKCYTFQMTVAFNNEDRPSQFEGCLNGEFQKRIDLEIFKSMGMDMLGIESCLLSASKNYPEIYKDLESLVKRVDNVLAESDDFDLSTSNKREKIYKENASKFEYYRQKLSAPARNVVTRGAKTTGAFTNSVPWVYADNLDRIKSIERKTREKIFNSTYLPAAQMDCQLSRNAIDTYQKLGRSLYSLTQSYRSGKEAVDAYSRSLDSKLDNIEMSLFQNYSKLNPGRGALRDMTHWITESRKGNIIYVEDMKRSLDYQNRNGIPNLKRQVQNYITRVDQKLSTRNYMMSLAGVVDSSQKRFKISGNEQPLQIKNLVELFSQDGVTIEDASPTISDLWNHGQKFSQIKLKC